MIPSAPSPRAALALAALLLVPAASARAEEARGELGEAVLERLHPLREAHGLPALAGLVIRSGRVGGIAAVGSRRAGSAEAVTVDDPWHLGSCTKAMTATLIGRLVEGGSLRWDSALGELFPELASTMVAPWPEVTLEQLLMHRAGAPAGLQREGLWGRLFVDERTPISELRRGVVASLTRHPPEHAPGGRFLYSNPGYTVAGAAAEQVLGRPYEVLLQELLLAPLAMARTGFGPPGRHAVMDAPWGHRRVGEALHPMDPAAFGADNPAAIAPAGTVHAPLEDWARFVALHLRGARGELRADDPLRERTTFEQLHFPRGDEGYALGWGAGQRPWAGGRVLTHSGSNTMWFATVVIAPDANAAALAVTNCGGPPAERACRELVRRLIELARGQG